MIFDSHVHTQMSSDSRMHIEEGIKAASQRNVGIIITEHFDPATDNTPKYAHWTPLDSKRFFEEYTPYRGDNLLLGIELGLNDLAAEENKAMAHKYDFDFLLGAVHAIGSEDLYMDLVHSEKHITTVKDYLEHNVFMTQNNPYIDSLAHIDYYSRYVKWENKDILYSEYKLLYKRIFEALLDTDTLLEVNTRRFDNEKAVKNLFEIYSSYYESGGRYVTIGSDAHRADAIACNFDRALKMIKEIGLTPVYFRQRQRIIVEL